MTVVLARATRIPAWFLVAGLALAPVPAGAQGADPQATAMIRAVLDQLAAFRRGDWSAAYGYASAAIQAQFPPEAFRQMVTGGYASIARSAQGTVLRTEVLDARRGYVEIRVEGQDGQTVDALYELVEESGAWRVNGVVTRPVARGSTASLRAAPSRAPRSAARRGCYNRDRAGVAPEPTAA
jgi:hypothetical protein